MPKPGASVVPVERRFLAETGPVKDVVDRATTYLRAGFPVHLSGPAGTGKTTLALHLAESLGNPCLVVQGDEQLTSTDLVRGPLSVRRTKMVDRYVRTVVRTAESYTEQWADGWLATACKRGYTLVYDEFTRSRPEANNVLLSVLEERVLMAARGQRDPGVVRVHPDFRMILTSNPIEYVGVYRAADALLDRLITIELDYFDEETEVSIVRGHTHLREPDCRRIVRFVRVVRERVEGADARPSLRSAVILGQVLKAAKLPVDFHNPKVAAFCLDVLRPAVSSADDLANMLGVLGSAGPPGRSVDEEG